MLHVHDDVYGAELCLTDYECLEYSYEGFLGLQEISVHDVAVITMSNECLFMLKHE